MATERIERNAVPIDLTLTTSSSTTPKFRFSAHAGGRVYIPSGSSITLLTWYDSDVEAGNYLASQDKNGLAITQTVAAGKSYPIPEGMYGAPWAGIVGNAAGAIKVSLQV